MKKLLISVPILLVLGVSSQVYAVALTTTDMKFVGEIVDAVPSGDQSVVDYINSLVQVANNTSENCALASSELCDRTGSNNPTGPGVAGLSSGVDGGTISATGQEYVYAKYGGGVDNGSALLWYMEGGFNEEVVVPGTFGGHAVSHTSLAHAVPEPSTLLLLGSGLLGLGVWRWRG